MSRFIDECNTLADKVLNYYWLGTGVVATALLIGNAYNGHRIAQRKLQNRFRYSGVEVGVIKASSYSFFSWGFLLYVLYRHLNRHAIAKAEYASGVCYRKNVLVGHWMMHFIPHVNDLIQFGHSDDTAFLTEKGILEEDKSK